MVQEIKSEFHKKISAQLAESKLNTLSRSSKSVWQKLRFELEEVVYDLNKQVDEALEKVH